MLPAEGRALMKCTGRALERKPGQEYANVMLLSQAEEFALLLPPSLEWDFFISHY